MVSAKKYTGRAISMPAGLALGGVISLVITVILSAILAWLIDRERLTTGAIGYGAMLILFISAAVGSLLACSKVKRMRLQVSLMSGVLYFLILLSMNALFFGGQYSGIGVTAMSILAGCISVTLPALRQGRGGATGRRKKITR